MGTHLKETEKNTCGTPKSKQTFFVNRLTCQQQVDSKMGSCLDKPASGRAGRTSSGLSDGGGTDGGNKKFGSKIFLKNYFELQYPPLNLIKNDRIKSNSVIIITIFITT